MLRLLLLLHHVAREAVQRRRRQHDETHQLPVIRKQRFCLVGQPEAHGDNVVERRQPAGGRVRRHIAVADGGERHEGVVEGVEESHLGVGTLRVDEEALE